MSFQPVDENLRAAMRAYSHVTEMGEARDYPAVTVTSCGLDCSIFNSAMLRGPVSVGGLRGAVTQATTHFGQRALGWSFWLCDDWLDSSAHFESRKILRSLGLSVVAEAPGMFAPALRPASRPAARLELRPVMTAGAREDFAWLSAMIFSLPSQTARDIYTSAPLWNSMLGWIGYERGRPVTMVSVVLAAGVAGVYSVGTLPECQRRGYAETMMRHALDQCRARSVVLQATAEGMGLYTRMGFQTVTHFSVYLNEGCTIH